MATVKRQSLLRSVRLALRPARVPPAGAAAGRALIASGAIAVIGVGLGDLQMVGVAYFAAACAATFATAAAYRGRFAALLAQGVGAAAGIAAGALLPHAAAVLIVTAAVAGVLSGVGGVLGPSAPAFGMMLSIGVAFGQFGGSTLPWWQQCCWYLVGTATVGAVALAPWAFRRGRPERLAAAAVFTRSAELCEAIGTADARSARIRLAAASAAARTSGGVPAAELTALAVAGLYAENRPVAPEVIAAIRRARDQVLHGNPVDVPIDMAGPAATADPYLRALAYALRPRPIRRPPPLRQRLLAAARTLRTPTALAAGVRIGLCMAVATAVAVALKRPGEHALWLPLTTAVIVRPEYASVFVRSVNRIAGTIAGAGCAAVVLSACSTGLTTASAAATALAAGVFLAPRLYAFAVTGVTASTLLSASLGHVALALPGVRILDTLLGAAVAVVFGYLLWPGARRLPAAARLTAAIDAAADYLDQAVLPPDRRAHGSARRDQAYRLAHQVRAAALVAISEPPPVSAAATRVLPRSTELEDVVDAITALAVRSDAAFDPARDAEVIRGRLHRLRVAARDLDRA